MAGSYNRPYIGPPLIYFGGTSIDAPSINTPYPFPVALGGHTYVIDLRYYARTSVEPFREASDFNASPGEHSLANEGAWKRNRADWSWGAGQHWADDPQSSDLRYRSSKGVDPWTPRELKLQHDTSLAKAASGSNLKLFVVNGFFYLIDGTGILSSTTPKVGSWATATCPAAIVSATTDGSTVYAAVASTGLYKSAAGSGTVAAMPGAAATLQADLIGYANGWLIAAVANVLSTVAADGTVATIFTHQNASYRWSVVASAPGAIYLGGNVGTHNEIYQVTVNQSTGALNVPVYAGGLPEGETLNTMTYYQGALLLGTSRGLRLASVDGSGNVSHGPLIDIARSVTALHSQGEFVWFSWRDYDSASTGIGRASLAVFTAPLVPAYASDLMATTQGAVSGIVTFDGERFFSVNSHGVYAQHANLVAQGVLDEGTFTYSVFEPKAIASIELVTAPLHGTVAMNVVDDNDTPTPIGTATTPSSTGIGNVFSGHDVLTEQLGLDFTLTRSADPTLGPVIRRFSIRALPIPGTVELFTVPIMLDETIEIGQGEGQDVGYDVGAEIDFLKNLERFRRPVTYQEGDHSYRVTVRSIQRPQGLPYKWNADRTAIEGPFLVNLATLED